MLFILFLFFYFDEKFNENGNYDDTNNYNNEKYLILYYADWCGYCNKFLPMWKELKNNTNLKNIKYIEVNMSDSNKILISGSENNTIVDKVKNAKILGFPTIKLLHNSDLIDYNGNREKEDLIKFINDN